jgi:carbonic anhydrase
MGELKDLLEKNRAWSEGIKANDPEFFRALAEQQLEAVYEKAIGATS